MASNIDPFTRRRSIIIQSPWGSKKSQLHTSHRWSRLTSPEEAHMAHVWAELESGDDQRLSTFSRWSSMGRAFSHRRPRASDFALELDSTFRMSWYTDLELFDGLSRYSTKVIEAPEEDPNVVDWDGPDDPENPLNWSQAKKWVNIATISTITLIT
jgi:hypothetical protein